MLKKPSLCGLFAGAALAALAPFCASSGFAAAETAPSPAINLPGGATALQETFNDWTVTCGVEGGTKICAASQQLVQKNGQRVLAVEVKPEAGVARIDVVLPFGLLLSDGISYQLDKGTGVGSASIKTCFPGGCVATFRLEPRELDAFRGATELKISAKTADSGQPFELAVSLNGFAKAYERLGQLLK